MAKVSNISSLMSCPALLAPTKMSFHSGAQCSSLVARPCPISNHAFKICRTFAIEPATLVAISLVHLWLAPWWRGLEQVIWYPIDAARAKARCEEAVAEGLLVLASLRLRDDLCLAMPAIPALHQ